MSLRTRLLIAVLPLSIAALILLALIEYYQAKSSIMQAQIDGMHQTMNIIEKQTDDWFEWNKDSVSLLAKEKSFVGALQGEEESKKESQTELTHSQNISGQYDSLILISKEGKVILNSVEGRSIGLDLMGLEDFSKVLNRAKSDTVMGNAFFSPATGRPIIFIAAPITSEGKLSGYVGATLAVDKLSENVLLKIKFGETGYPLILQEDGVTFAHPVTKHQLTLDIKKLGWSDLILGKREGIFYQVFQGVEKIYVFNFSEKHHLYYLASAPTEEFLQSINKSRVMAIIITILAIILLSSVLIIITQSITNKIGKVSKGVSSGAAEILSASHSIASASQTLSAATTEQASSIQETSSSMEELTAMVGVNLDSAKTSSDMADNLTKISEQAALHTVELEASMNKLKQSNLEIKELERIIEGISDKTKVIDEIVFQTKLLSFNASVEAERAGEHGRGFAVVAQEVGNLAQMSGTAAQEIGVIIKNSMTQSHEVTQRNDSFVLEGVQVLIKLKEIVATIEKASKEVEEQSKKITSASNEQHLGIKQINEAISQLDQTTQQNASISEASASASEQMLRQANSLTKLIDELEDITHGAHQHQEERELKKSTPRNSTKKIPTKLNRPKEENWDQL